MWREATENKSTDANGRQRDICIVWMLNQHNDQHLEIKTQSNGFRVREAKAGVEDDSHCPGRCGPSCPQLFRQNFPFLLVAEGAGRRAFGCGEITSRFVYSGTRDEHKRYLYFICSLLRILLGGLANERSIIEIF